MDIGPEQRRLIEKIATAAAKEIESNPKIHEIIAELKRLGFETNLQCEFYVSLQPSISQGLPPQYRHLFSPDGTLADGLLTPDDQKFLASLKIKPLS